MSLREKLDSQQAEKLAAQTSAQEQKQEQVLACRRASIAQITDNQKNLTELRSQIGTDLESFLNSVKSRKEKSELIDQIFKDFGNILLAKGITSRGDLVAKEEFQEEQEVKDYKATKEEIRTKASKVREVVGKIREAISDLTIRIQNKVKEIPGGNSPQVWHKRISAIIEDKVKELDNELANLKLQTPEGQEERQQQYRDRVEKKITKSNLNFYQTAVLNELDQMRILNTEDLNEARVIGEGHVKGIAGKAYMVKIETDFNKERQIPERAQVRYLMEYENQLRPIQKSIHDVENKRKEILLTLEQLGKTNRKLGESISLHHYHWDADQYLNNLEYTSSGLNSTIRLSDVAAILKRSKIIADDINHGGNIKRWITLDNDHRATFTQIPDLDNLLSWARQYSDYYTRLSEQLQPENLTITFDDLAALKTTDGKYSNSKQLKIDAKLQEELIQRPFSVVRDREIKQDEKDNRQKEKIISLIHYKINTDWAELRQELYQRDNAEIIWAAKQQKRQTIIILEELDKKRNELNEHLHSRVQIRQNDSSLSREQRYEIDPIDYTKKENEIVAQSKTITKEIENIEKRIQEKNKEINKAWLKGKLKTAAMALIKQQEQLTQEKEILFQEYQANRQLYDSIASLGKVLGTIILKENIVDKTMTIEELFTHLLQLDGTLPDLTDEQKEKIAKYNSLEQVAREANKQYERLRRAE